MPTKPYLMRCITFYGATQEQYDEALAQVQADGWTITAEREVDLEFDAEKPEELPGN